MAAAYPATWAAAAAGTNSEATATRPARNARTGRNVYGRGPTERDVETASAILEAALGLSATKAEELNTLQVCVRAVVVFIILIAFVRFGKKRFLGKATAFDAILVIMIGSIASRAISGTAPFIPSLAGTFVLILTHWIISYFS